MTTKEILKKQIIYRSIHRGSKEMDLLLSNFVKRYIHKFNEDELKELLKILSFEDEILYKWYFDKKNFRDIPENRISKLLKNFNL